LVYANTENFNKRFVRIEQDGKLTIMEWLEVIDAKEKWILIDVS
jgi:hypothetical protein